MKFGWINLLNGIIVVLLLIPNLVYALKKRSRADAGINVPTLLSVCEQIGRYACMLLMVLPLFVGKFGFQSPEALLTDLFLNVLLLSAYYLIWFFYAKKPDLKSGMTLTVLPTLIFLFSGLFLRHWLLITAAVLFGISHGWITRITHAGKKSD